MADPFNWPMPSRGDLMSLSTLNQKRDMTRVKTASAAQRPRNQSLNMHTADIDGRYLAPAGI